MRWLARRRGGQGTWVVETRNQLQERAGLQARRPAGNVRRLADGLREMSCTGKLSSTAAAAAVAQLVEGGRRAALPTESRGTRA